MAKTPETAAKSTGRKGAQISATIPQPLYDALDDHRWTARIDGMTQLNRIALEEYAANHGIVVADPAADESGK